MTVSKREKGKDPDRHPDGRFRKGCKGGPGNPNVKKLGEHRAAIKAAVKPADLRRAIQALAGKAADGDVQACRLLLDCTVGRAPVCEEAGSGPGLKLPPLDSMSACNDAIAQVLSAIGQDLSVQEAVALATVVETARKVLESMEFEARVERLEKEFKLEREYETQT